MSERDLAKSLIDQIPESNLYAIIAYLREAVIPDETPNASLMQAIEDARNHENLAGPFYTAEEAVASMLED